MLDKNKVAKVIQQGTEQAEMKLERERVSEEVAEEVDEG